MVNGITPVHLERNLLLKYDITLSVPVSANQDCSSVEANSIDNWATESRMKLNQVEWPAVFNENMVWVGMPSRANAWNVLSKIPQKLIGKPCKMPGVIWDASNSTVGQPFDLSVRNRFKGTPPLFRESFQVLERTISFTSREFCSTNHEFSVGPTFSTVVV